MSELERFVDALFGKEVGYVYAPLGYRDDTGSVTDFVQYHFKWPDHREVLLRHCRKQAAPAEVYLSPVLYADREFTFSKARFVWADFDEGTDGLPSHFPEATIRVGTSAGKKQHLYWQLEVPLTDQKVLEDYNRRIAYAFGADTVCWNYNRVLRPPETFNRKYDPPFAVACVSHTKAKHSDFVFADLPKVEDKQERYEFEWESTDAAEILKAPGLRQEFIDFFTQDTPVHRAKSLTSIAITGVESGLKRDYVMSLLDDAAYRWDKFTGRRDRAMRLCSIYSYAEKVAAPPLASPEAGFLSYRAFRSQRRGPIDWILHELIHSTAFALVTAPPGVGKTQFCLDMAYCLATGTRFLEWDIKRPYKVAFLSLELDEQELDEYLNTMEKRFKGDNDKLNLVYENFGIRCEAALRLNADEKARTNLLHWVDYFNPDVIIIDSLSRLIAGDLTSKSEIDPVVDFINVDLRKKRKKCVVAIHHNNKPQSTYRGIKPPRDLNQVYGSVFFSAYVSTAIGLWKENNKRISVHCLKRWLRKDFPVFYTTKSEHIEYVLEKKGGISY